MAPAELNAGSSPAPGVSCPAVTQDNPHGYPLAILDLLWLPWGQSLTLQIIETGLTEGQEKKKNLLYPRFGEFGSICLFLTDHRHHISALFLL